MIIGIFILLVGLFILGMSMLRYGLFHLSGESLKIWLTKTTDVPWKGFLAGILITCLLQSSSAVMIITIGLISVKMLTFPQSIGIILGTNIGTTITTELITFDIGDFLLPFVIVAIVLLFMKKKKFQSTGLILLGISFVFMAMGGFEYLAIPLKEFGIIDTLLSNLDKSYLLSVSSRDDYYGSDPIKYSHNGDYYGVFIKWSTESGYWYCDFTWFKYWHLCRCVFSLDWGWKRSKTNRICTCVAQCIRGTNLLSFYRNISGNWSDSCRKRSRTVSPY